MKLSLFGAPLDTGNLGVSALGHSVMAALVRRMADLELTVFDFGRGQRRLTTMIDGSNFRYSAFGSVLSSRLYRPENLLNMRVSGLLGGLRNRGVHIIRDCNAALDITGGDSFTDMYGSKRFRAAVLRKRIVLQQGVPLVLLPQTYGPFRGSYAKETARRIIEQAGAVWARDEQSLIEIDELFKNGGVPPHCRLGVDVAFLLSAAEPCGERSRTIRRLLDQASEPKVGVNVSGLLLNSPAATSRFGLRADYYKVVVELITRLCRESEAQIYLVPHVLAGSGERGSDVSACERVYEDVRRNAQGRVTLLDTKLDQNEMKWFIGQMDWFCGARMHSTIAALSSSVPAAILAYSDKALGVFGSCEQASSVLDMRVLDTGQVVRALLDSWEGRESARHQLRQIMPQVMETASSQMDEIASFCTASTVHSA